MSRANEIELYDGAPARIPMPKGATADNMRVQFRSYCRAHGIRFRSRKRADGTIRMSLIHK